MAACWQLRALPKDFTNLELLYTYIYIYIIDIITIPTVMAILASVATTPHYTTIASLAMITTTMLVLPLESLLLLLLFLL